MYTDLDLLTGAREGIRVANFGTEKVPNKQTGKPFLRETCHSHISLRIVFVQCRQLP